MRLAAGIAQGCNCLVEAVAVIIAADDDSTFARHDFGGRSADPVGKRGDQRDLVGEPHPFPFRSPILPSILKRWPSLSTHEEKGGSNADWNAPAACGIAGE